MTLKQAIAMADLMVENSLPMELKIMWLNECEGLVQTEVLRVIPDEIVSYTAEDLEKELLTRAPHHKLYVSYLTACIHFAHLEYDLYATTQARFNEDLGTFARWFFNSYKTGGAYINETPATIATAWRGWYLTAYGIAVKHGFAGDEAQWLTSLKGDKGEPALLRYDPESGYIQWQNRGDAVWQDLIPVGELLDAAVADATAEAEQRAASAKLYAEAAESSRRSAEIHEQRAILYADASAASAAEADSYARAATEAAQAAVEAAGEAGAFAGQAAASATAAGLGADAATSAARDAKGYAATAQQARDQARTAATNASNRANDAQASAEAAALALEQTLEAHEETDLLTRHAENAREAAEAAAARAEEAADRAEAAGGGTLSAAGDGDDIVITTTGLAVTAEGDDIILGG